MLKRTILILIVILIPMILIAEENPTKEELIQALIESNQQLETSKNTIQMLTEREQMWIKQFETLETRWKNYQEIVAKYPLLLTQLRTEFEETKSSYIDYKEVVNLQISELKRDNTILEIIAFTTSGGLIGTIIGIPLENPMMGLLVGGGSGLATWGIIRVIGFLSP